MDPLIPREQSGARYMKIDVRSIVFKPNNIFNVCSIESLDLRSNIKKHKLCFVNCFSAISSIAPSLLILCFLMMYVMNENIAIHVCPYLPNKY